MGIRIEQLVNTTGTMISKTDGAFLLNYNTDQFTLTNPSTTQELLTLKDGGIPADKLDPTSMGDGLQVVPNTGPAIPNSSNVITVKPTAPLVIVGGGGGAGVGGGVGLALAPLGGLQLLADKLALNVKPADVGGLKLNGGGGLAFDFPASGSISPTTTSGSELSWMLDPTIVDGVTYMPTYTKNAGAFTFGKIDSAISSTPIVGITSSDTAPAYLYSKIAVTNGLAKAVGSSGGNETLDLTLNLSTSIGVDGSNNLIIPTDAVETAMIQADAVTPNELQDGVTYDIDVTSVDGVSVGTADADLWIGTTVIGKISDETEGITNPIDEFTTTDPSLGGVPFNPAPADGYRIITLVGGVYSGYTFTANNIYQYDLTTTTWLETVPVDGTIVYNRTDNTIYSFDGATWTSAAGGSGEINTASSIGVAGQELYSAKVGVDLQFKNVGSADAKITVTADATDVTFTADETQFDHDNLLNTHNLTTDIDHSSITNTHNLTTDIDHASITNTHNLTTDIDHDQLTNYAANRHYTPAEINLEDLGDVATGAATGEVLTKTAGGWEGAAPTGGSSSSWEDPVLEKTSTVPGGPSIGDRYLIETGAVAPWDTHADEIAQWSGSAWAYTTPVSGDIVYVIGETLAFIYSGTSWVDAHRQTNDVSIPLSDKYNFTFMQTLLGGAITGNYHVPYGETITETGATLNFNKAEVSGKGDIVFNNTTVNLVSSTFEDCQDILIQGTTTVNFSAAGLDSRSSTFRDVNKLSIELDGSIHSGGTTFTLAGTTGANANGGNIFERVSTNITNVGAPFTATYAMLTLSATSNNDVIKDLRLKPMAAPDTSYLLFFDVQDGASGWEIENIYYRSLTTTDDIKLLNVESTGAGLMRDVTYNPIATTSGSSNTGAITVAPSAATANHLVLRDIIGFSVSGQDTGNIYMDRLRVNPAGTINIQGDSTVDISKSTTPTLTINSTADITVDKTNVNDGNVAITADNANLDFLDISSGNLTLALTNKGRISSLDVSGTSTINAVDTVVSGGRLAGAVSILSSAGRYANIAIPGGFTFETGTSNNIIAFGTESVPIDLGNNFIYLCDNC